MTLRLHFLIHSDMKSPKLPLFGILLALSLSSLAEQLINPIAHCADCVMMKHRGTYYMTGTGAHGLMLTSKNLTDWTDPAPFFQTQLKWTDEEHTLEMHAPGFKYYNGQFYFYWNGIACATSKEVLGPYRDLDLNERFDGEIDPFLFIDEDGAFYFYTVKFDHGNMIYGQAMETPLKLQGEATRLLTPRPNSWETRHENILEGPEVVRYRNTYYMLYAGNHTSVKYGHYLMGCAVADTPLGFNESSKYPYPVMEQSDERITDSVQTLIPWESEWRYSTHEPVEDWMNPNFTNAASWAKGTSAFGWPIRNKSRIHNIKTEWKTDDIWMRKEFELTEHPSENLQLKIRHIGGAKIYFNGKLVYNTRRTRGPRLVTLSKKEINALHIGKNVIAVHCKKTQKKRYIEVGLIDPIECREDDLIWNTGQPNLVRGPNGFEWFVSYFALWNEGPHMQGINRVFFFDRELHIDGPTGSRPPQYQPRPYSATFSDNMDQPGPLSPEKWECIGGTWHADNSQVEVKTTGTTIALIHAKPAINYLFQAWVKPEGNGPCGIVAWHVDGKNSMVLQLDPHAKKLICTTYLNGKKTLKDYPLHDGFDFSAYHKIRFEKNADLAEIWIDDTRLTRTTPLKVPANKTGRPGLFVRQTTAAFDAVTYTIGWDEFDDRIRGWNAVQNSVVHTKGDWMKNYEFSAQLSFLKNKKAGVFPVYIDPENYLYIEIESSTYRLQVSGKRNGKALQRLEKDLTGWKRLYQSSDSDLHLKRPGKVSSIKLQFEKERPTDFSLEYQDQSGNWVLAENLVSKDTILNFQTLETDHLRITPTEGHMTRAYAWVKGAPSLNIRTVKLQDKVLVMIDGKQVLEIPGAWPASKVGFSEKPEKAAFNGISCFQIP